MVGIERNALEGVMRGLAELRFDRRGAVLAAVILGVAGGVASALYLHPFDVTEYERYGHAALHAPLLHRLPNEYPAPALVLFMVPLAVPLPYSAGFALEMGAVLVVLVLGYGKGIEQTDGEDPTLRLVAYLAVGAVMVLAGRYDLAAAAAAFWAVRAGGQGRFSRAWGWSVVGVLLKVFPAALWPVLFVAEWRATGRPPWRRTLWAAGAVAGIAIVPLVTDPHGLLDIVHYYLHRPVEIGSIASGLSLLADWGGTHWVVAAHSLSVQNPVAGDIAVVTEAAAVVGCVAVWWAQARRRLSLQAAALATLTLVVLGAKVLSVQYLIWLIPLWALYRMRLSWMLGALIGTAVFPYASSVIGLHYLGDRAFGDTLTLAYLARDVLVAAGTLAWLRSELLARRAQPPSLDQRRLTGLAYGRPGAGDGQ